MPRSMRIAYFAHAIRSDWNNGNAHFLRGLLRALGKLEGICITAYEPMSDWSVENLRHEAFGAQSLQQFETTYPDLDLRSYSSSNKNMWEEQLGNAEIVIVHEWNTPQLVTCLLSLRARLGFRILFHDTHHRASSSSEEIARLGLASFDGIIAFGHALQEIYQHRFGVERVWVLHEAADTSVFHPREDIERQNTVVWIGNWGEDERSQEIRDFLLEPARVLSDRAQTIIYGVRYPEDGMAALAAAGVGYGGYLPNLLAPEVYAHAKATVHVPRQQYSRAVRGIPTIRVFEALACGIPLVSAPWEDSEGLFREGDFLWAANTQKMAEQLSYLLSEPEAAREQAERGRETVLARHTCDHRARELVAICEEVLR